MRIQVDLPDTKDIKLIIFDLDGTLINAYPAITGSFNYVMLKLGYVRQKPLTIRRAVGWGDKNLLKPFVRIKDLDKALSLYRRHHKQALLKHSRVFAKVYQVLEYLKNKGYKLAIASNRPTRFSWILIRHLKLKKYFDYVLCADKLRAGKPHPEILNKIVREFRTKSTDTMYVGDMVIDAQAGRRAGIRTIILTTGSNTEKEIRTGKPYLIIKNITELKKVF